MNFTINQQKAIDTSNTNIIVSAGAGSGKTAVLVERVYKHILKDHFNIDEMLVVTFTNAAAFEMKKRIRKKLQADNNLTKEEKLKQINKIDSSFIMTFDAYALSLVKKYHYLLDVDKNVKIIDSSILNIKINELLDKVMENHYLNMDSKFSKLVKDYCVNNDNKIRDLVINVNRKLNMIYDRDNYCKNYIDNYYSDDAIEKLLFEYTDLLKEKIVSLRKYINELSNDIDIEKTYKNIDQLLFSETYKDISNNVANIEIGRSSNPSDSVKKLKEDTKKLIDEIKELSKDNKETLISDYLSTKDNVLYIIRLANELNELVDDYKKKNNLYDFTDVFKMAIEIVDKHENIRLEIKDYFKEILIDEYQDTNDLQDLFVSKIENNNVYMVGDIKQSIYRFRNANPNLFKNKFQKYKNGDNGIAIELPDNFRSRSGVLNSINEIFERIMDLDIGGADYKDGHALKYGQLQYSNNNPESINDKLEILNYQYDKKEYPFTSFDSDLVEAFIIGKDIKDKIANKYQVSYFDDNGIMKLRDCKYSDFTILMDRGNSFDDYKQILTYLNIPSSIETDEKISESDLTTAIVSFFKLLRCISLEDFSNEFVHAYVSLSRNFVMETKDSEIFDVVRNLKFKNTELYKIVKEISINAKEKAINEILSEFIDKFDVYSKIVKIGDVKENEIKIDYFYQLAKTLNDMGYDYVLFDDYLTEIINDPDNEIRFSTKKDTNDAVTITNIHKSKGLEYNILYLPTLTRAFNRSDIRDNYFFSNTRGLIIPTFIDNRGLKNTFVKQIYKNELLLEDVSEKIRLFYVALTRSKEKIIMVISLSDKQKDYVSKEDKLSFNCFSDMLNVIYEDLNNLGYIKDIDLNSYVFDGNYSLGIRDIFNKITVNNKKIEIKKLNEIKPTNIKESSYSKKSGLIDANTISKMEYGTKLHYYLELLDLHNPDYHKVDRQYVDKIKAFIESELMTDIKNGKTYKEYEFIYNDNGESKHGFIDLLVEYEDHFDIIDYKLKNIDDDNYDKQLNGYRKYINSISNKKVNCYLYSIMDSTYREVENENWAFDLWSDRQSNRSIKQ